MKKRKNCVKEKRWHFLWWSGISTNENHDWAYITRKYRICSKCKRRELYFGELDYDREDWRKTK